MYLAHRLVGGSFCQILRGVQPRGLPMEGMITIPMGGMITIVIVDSVSTITMITMITYQLLE